MEPEPEAPPRIDPPKPAAEGDAPAIPGVAPLTPTQDAPPVEETVTAPPVEETAAAPPVEETVTAPPVEEIPPAPPVEEEPPAAQAQPGRSPSPAKEGPPGSSPAPSAREMAPSGEMAPPADATARTKPARAWIRWPIRILFVLFGLAIAAGVVVLVFGPGYARGRIEEEARARGVVLAFGEMELGISRIRLHDVRVGLSGVRDFEAAAAWIDVALADWLPTSVAAGDLAISMAGTEVIGELGAWKNAHADALAAPLSAEGAKVDWRPSTGTANALSLSGAKVAVDAQKGSIDASTAQLVGRSAGALLLAWTSTQEGFVVEVTPRTPPLSAARVEVRSAKEGARVRLTLARTALGPLQDALGIPKGSEGISVDGEVEMPLPSLAKPAPVEGSLRLSVKGYTPPHPRELDGILFGDTTTVKSKLLLAADFNSAKLTGLTAEAGALSLSGSGDVKREGLDARVSLKLKGSIPCTSLATSAAVARLGKGLGGLAGGLAAGALKGSVGVSLSVEARASDIKGAKITQSAKIGCKVSIPGLPTIVIR